MSEATATVNRTGTAQRVTWVGAIVNLVLAILKIIVGIIGHSAALVADGVHSLSDLVSDWLVLLASKHGAQPADDDHPYGHARIETAATVVLGAMLMVVAIGIAWNAVERSLAEGEVLAPTVMAIAVALLSLASKEWLYQYTMKAARMIKSRLLEANAWHHRSDAISSLVVLVGIAGAMAGYTVLDAIAAFIVALMIAHIAWELISNSVKELIDTAVDDETQQQIVQLITETDGVLNLHMLRSRMMGANILVDAHIQVSPRLSVSEGHHIAETVEYKLKHRVENMQDVTIHIDPEDDEEAPLNSHLPLRSELLAQLQPQWSHIQTAALIKEIKLHYLAGKVAVEITLPMPEGGSSEAKKIQAEFAKVAENHDLLATIEVSFE